MKRATDVKNEPLTPSPRDQKNEPLTPSPRDHSGPRDQDKPGEAQLAGLKRHSQESREFVRSCLKKAMVTMAKEMDYKDVTVTALCKKAGVSRMAFYRNYEITNDVIFEIAREMNSRIVDEVGSPFRESTSREWYVKTFKIIQQYREEMSLMFQENFQYQWMKIVNNFAVHDDRFPVEQKYQRLMWSGGFENILSYWLNNGMKESPEELAEYCVLYLPHILHSDMKK